MMPRVSVRSGARVSKSGHVHVTTTIAVGNVVTTSKKTINTK